jgi:hypothetical protein
MLSADPSTNKTIHPWLILCEESWLGFGNNNPESADSDFRAACRPRGGECQVSLSAKLSRIFGLQRKILINLLSRLNSSHGVW